MVGRLNSLSTDAVHKDGPAVTVTASVTHIRQVHFNQPVDGALVQSIPGLVQMQSSVIQFSTREATKGIRTTNLFAESSLR